MEDLQKFKEKMQLQDIQTDVAQIESANDDGEAEELDGQCWC